MKAKACACPGFADRIGEHLRGDDDRDFWDTAVQTIIPDAEILCHRCSGKYRIFAQVGGCSHWLSPHNKGSWFPDPRFAWPTGYGRNGSLIFGLPEFDWSVSWEWIMGESRWEPIGVVHGKRFLLFRVALPARTARHVRAVAHTLWTPGPPTVPKKELLQGYAFAKMKDGWHSVGISGSDEPYE
jgi:hypothetical protein